MTAHSTRPDSCPVCQHSTVPWYTATDINRRVSNERFHYRRCPSCHTQYLENVPADLGRYYASDYHMLPRALDELDAVSAPEAYKVDLIRSLKPEPGKRLLEIGPSVGYFARQAQRAGFQVHVVEMSADCCKFLRDTVGIEVTHSAAISGALEPGRKYDVIALWQVVEHLPNAIAELEALASHLAPQGVLVVAAPNPESLQARMLGRYWWHLDAPRHVTLVPPEALVERVERFGLRRELVTATDRGSLEWNRLGWHFSLVNPFKLRFLRSIAKRVAWLLARVFGPFERRGLHGSTYTLVWRKA